MKELQEKKACRSRDVFGLESSTGEEQHPTSAIRILENETKMYLGLVQTLIYIN